MKRFLKYRKLILVSVDILLIPALFFCQWLSGYMLSKPGVCIWTIFGGQCITCGGTHFVNTLLHGEIVQAFHHNPLLFIYTVLLLLSFILLHLWWIWNISFAKKVLRVVYSIPGLIVFCCSLLVFLFIRNYHLFEFIFQYFFQKIAA